jgi:preprotein translocase subunit SecE
MRRGRRGAGAIAGFAQTVREMAKTNPMEFVQQVRREVAKVTWPSRKETTVSTVMVFIFVFLAAGFFFLVDQLLAVLVRLVLGIGG